MLLSKNDIGGLKRILAVAFRNGASPKKILTLLDQSIANVYAPHGGWSEHEYDIAFLVKSIGGP